MACLRRERERERERREIQERAIANFALSPEIFFGVEPAPYKNTYKTSIAKRGLRRDFFFRTHPFGEHEVYKDNGSVDGDGDYGDDDAGGEEIMLMATAMEKVQVEVTAMATVPMEMITMVATILMMTMMRMDGGWWERWRWRWCWWR